MANENKITFEVKRTGYIHGTYYAAGQEVQLYRGQAKHFLTSGQVAKKQPEEKKSSKKNLESAA